MSKESSRDMFSIASFYIGILTATAALSLCCSPPMLN